MTSEHSKEPSLEQLTLSQEVFPVSRFLSPGNDAARTILATSGRQCSGLLTRRDRVSSWLRTLLASSTWHSTVYLLTWKPSGTPQGRLLFRLAPSTRFTDEIASGSWPTATAVTRPMEGNVRLLRAKVESGELTEAEATAMLGKSPMESQGKIPSAWPTPNTPNGGRAWPKDAEMRGNSAYRPNGQKVQVHLHHLVEQQIPSAWPTPRAGNSYRDTQPTPSNLNGTHGWSTAGAVIDSLSEQPIRAWPTPDTQNHRDGTYRRKDSNLEQGGRHGVSLHHAVTAFPTPSAADNRDRGGMDTPAVQRRIEKGKQVMLSMQVQQETGQKLHGRWTLALMGYPPNWCDDLGPMEPGK